ncbi:MAG: glutamine--fructose-6-phosphate transaminase (isomerizing) [Arsenophonus sp.]|nr:MAG: glutamine--fructose-6-phosphate transaminase (isomerizing) [Arsenophonus sp.]
MCGIVGIVAKRNIVDMLINGLRPLEYRGYDSAGLAIIDDKKNMIRIRKIGKVENLANAVKKKSIVGSIGIAHTRWATHGKPTEKNAHPHISDNIAVVHNGIIENYKELRKELKKNNYIFQSNTDTEVIAHLINLEYKNGGTLLEIIQRIVPKLYGSYSIVVMDKNNPEVLIAARSSSPLIIGLGFNENFLASDQLAILSFTNNLIYLKEGDIAEITFNKVRIFDKKNKLSKRKKIISNVKYSMVDKGNYNHFLKKEIFEQPLVIKKTFKKYINFKTNTIFFNNFDNQINDILSKIEHIQIIACGTSYHAGIVAKYWFELLSKIPCDVDIASEFRYRNPAHRKNSLLIAISQSGETADTLAALKISKKIGYISSIAICNVHSSSLVRESEFSLITQAGIEISVASTKSFTTQLTLLLLLITYISNLHQKNKIINKQIINELSNLPNLINSIILNENKIQKLAKNFSDKKNIIFLGRGIQYPIAMEGALKIKELSYIHAEAYPAGELKHGPLALIDSSMPVIMIVQNDNLLEKLKSNIEEVCARGGLLYIFTDISSKLVEFEDNIKIITLPNSGKYVTPILYTIPLQMLAYHIAIIKGTDIDRPRNLAKSVTVE